MSSPINIKFCKNNFENSSKSKFIFFFFCIELKICFRELRRSKNCFWKFYRIPAIFEVVKCLLASKLNYLLYAVRLWWWWSVCRLTRFGEISRLWQIFKSLCQILKEPYQKMPQRHLCQLDANFFATGQIFFAEMAEKLKNNIVIWSHCQCALFLRWRSRKQVTLCG